jgi:hypothetical protein
MKNFLLQQQKNNELIIKQTKEKAEKEIFVLEQQLEMKTKQLELVLHHQGTLQNLVDIAQQGEEYTITEFISSSCTQMAGYLIKQQQNQIKNTSGCGSVFLKSQNNYQQQYFVLQGTQLSFYDTKKHFEKNPNESSPMEMKGAKIEDTFVVPEAFCIIFSEETNHESFVIHLHAKSVQVKKEWVDRLRRAATGRPGSFISSLPQDNNSQYRSNPPSPISTSLAPDGDDKPSGLLLSKASPNKAELYQANDTSEDNNFQQ